MSVATTLMDKILGDLAPQLPFGKAEKTAEGLKLTIPITELAKIMKEQIGAKGFGMVDINVEGTSIVITIKVM
jgi:hypothetical protein